MRSWLNLFPFVMQNDIAAKYLCHAFRRIADRPIRLYRQWGLGHWLTAVSEKSAIVRENQQPPSPATQVTALSRGHSSPSSSNQLVTGKTWPVSSRKSPAATLSALIGSLDMPGRCFRWDGVSGAPLLLVRRGAGYGRP